MHLAIPFSQGKNSIMLRMFGEKWQSLHSLPTNACPLSHSFHGACVWAASAPISEGHTQPACNIGISLARTHWYIGQPCLLLDVQELIQSCYVRFKGPTPPLPQRQAVVK